MTNAKQLTLCAITSRRNEALYRSGRYSKPAQMGDRGMLPHHEERVPGALRISQPAGAHCCPFHHMLHLAHPLQIPGEKTGQPVYCHSDHRHAIGNEFHKIRRKRLPTDLYTHGPYRCTSLRIRIMHIKINGAKKEN